MLCDNLSWSCGIFPILCLCICVPGSRALPSSEWDRAVLWSTMQFPAGFFHRVDRSVHTALLQGHRLSTCYARWASMFESPGLMRGKAGHGWMLPWSLSTGGDVCVWGEDRKILKAHLPASCLTLSFGFSERLSQSIHQRVMEQDTQQIVLSVYTCPLMCTTQPHPTPTHSTP